MGRKRKPDQTYWVIWPGSLTKEEVEARYKQNFGRKPDIIHSPEESATPWWWTGWVSKEEYMKYATALNSQNES